MGLKAEDGSAVLSPYQVACLRMILAALALSPFTIQALKKIVARLEERLETLQAEKMEQGKPPKVSSPTVVARSCEELRHSNDSVQSGMYWIDPDGHAAGDAPIYVACNMTTGCLK